MNQNFRVRPNSGIKRIETKEVKKKATNPVRVIETHNYLSNCYNNDPDRIGSIKKKEKNNNFHGI